MAEPPFPTKQWADWARSFSIVQDDLIALAARRMIHRSHLQVIEDHEIADGTGIVHRWMLDNYAESMLIGLRRVIDRRSDSFSLLKLLEELQRNHSTIRLERYLELCRDMEPSRPDTLGRALFARFSSNGVNLDPTKVAADVDELLQTNEAILAYTNSVVAHRKREPKDEATDGLTDEVTWEDLDGLFDQVVRLFNWYLALVRPGVYVDVNPVLPAGYEQAFRRMIGRGDG